MKVFLILLFVFCAGNLSFSQDENYEYEYDYYDYNYDTADTGAEITTETSENLDEYDYTYTPDENATPLPNLADADQGIETEIIDPTNFTPNNYITTNIVEITNNIIIPDIVPISLNACVAILRGLESDVELFIQRDPNLVTMTRGDGNNLLHVASIQTNTNIINFLIKSGVDLNHTNNVGRTPLHVAAQVNNTAAIQTLLRNKAIVNIKDKFGHTPLWIANVKNYPRSLKLLAVAQSAQSTTVINTNKTLADSLVQNGLKVPSNFDLYSQLSKKLVHSGMMGKSVWHKALFSPGFVNSQNLIDSGIDPYQKDEKGQNAFHIAALYDNIEALLYLTKIYPKIKLDTKDKFGNTPLHIASGQGSSNTLKLLLNIGCNINAKNNAGWTPLFSATLLGNEANVRLFLSQGIDPNSANKIGRTPLMEASRLGYEFILRDLILAGADINLTDNKGNTAFSLAAQQGFTDILAQLLEEGAVVNTQNIYQKSPLILAVERQHLPTVQFLLEKAGSLLVESNRLGQNVLDIAYINGNPEIIAYLAEKYTEIQRTGARTSTVTSPLPLEVASTPENITPPDTPPSSVTPPTETPTDNTITPQEDSYDYYDDYYYQE